MQIDTSTTPALDVYHALVGIVTPRPIAWVTTLGANGVVNLAPFSFYNTFSANPPVVVFSPTLRRDGTKKDTLRNIEANGEFVVHAAVESLAEQLNLSSKEIPPDESEMTLTGLSGIASSRVKPPRIAAAPVSMECKLRQLIPLGNGPIAGNLVIGDILLIHIADHLLDAHGRVDPRKLKTIARLGGDFYCTTKDLFEMKRP